MSADMEGVLYKWTNYMTGCADMSDMELFEPISENRSMSWKLEACVDYYIDKSDISHSFVSPSVGYAFLFIKRSKRGIKRWQPRWFVLDDGIISYYDCQDDVVKGSKGSIKMSVCEIKVHPTDSGRLELIIPGEQHFYVRAVNAAERQRWLVALGSSKAGLLDTRTKTEREQAERTDSLRTKMSELRLYCDLLVQQVHTLQHCHHATSCHDITSCSAPLGGDVTSCSDITSSPHSPNSETRLEAASLLSATCSTFIRTLEECVSLADAHLLPDSAHSPVSPSPLQMTRMKRSISHPGTYSFDRWGQRSAQRRTRTCSDTEAGRTGYDSDRALPCLRGSVNGDSAPCIPEERGGGASPRGGGVSPRGGGVSPRATSDTDTPETDVSM